MNTALNDYIEAARKRGHHDEQISKDLVAGGWSETAVASALKGEEPLEVPPPPPPVQFSPAAAPQFSANSQQPQAVVQTLTTRGFEYTIMFIAMGIAALSLGSVLHATINSVMGPSTEWFFGGDASFSSAALLVALPVFAILFLRLKKAELADPAATHNDPSRKRMVQLTLIVTFLVGIGNIIFYIYSLMNPDITSGYSYSTTGSESSISPFGNLVHLLVTLIIAGGIFAYYWRDAHRPQ